MENRKGIRGRRIVYRGDVFDVEEFTIGRTGTRFSNVLVGDVVGILPIMNNGKILLERQYRYTIRKELYEIPAGHVEKREGRAAAAGRELEEETGYRARKLTHMTSFYSAPGVITEVMHLYLAEGMKKTRSKLDLDEVIETAEVGKAEMLSMIKQNKIEDGKSIAAFLYYLHFIEK